MIIPSSTLGNNSWSTISTVSSKGLASQYWSVGAYKTIVINGAVTGYTFNNFSVKAFIIGINHNSSREGTNKIHFQIGKTSNNIDIAFCDNNYGGSEVSSGFIMNTSNTNTGGWSRSYGRNTLLNSGFWYVLPSDLRSVIKRVNKYTDNTGDRDNTQRAVSSTSDLLFFLSEFEVSNSWKYANQYEQNYQLQYQYYKSGNSTVKYRHNTSNVNVYWWCRSPDYHSVTFCQIASDGQTYAGLHSNYSSGVSFGFVV